MRRLMLVVLGVLLGGGVLASCATAPTSPASTTTGPAGSTTSTSIATRTTASPSTSTTTVALPNCQPSQLQISVVGESGAAGTQERTVGMRDVSSASCSMYGYPGMLLLNARGTAEPTTVDRGGGLAFENIDPSEVVLEPGEIAYFNLGFSDVVAIPTACSDSSSAEITPPNDTEHSVVALSVQACANGVLHVSAVFASSDRAATQTTAPNLMPLDQG